MAKEIVKKIVLPDIIKESDQLDSKNFKSLLQNMAMRVSIEASLVAIFEIVKFEHVNNISIKWSDRGSELSFLMLSPKLVFEGRKIKNNVKEILTNEDKKEIREYILNLAAQYNARTKKYYSFRDYHSRIVYGHILNVNFEESFFLLTDKEKNKTIKKIEDNLKKSRMFYKLVKLPAREDLKQSLKNIFNDKKIAKIDKNNYQMMINDYMPFGWGGYRQSVLIEEAINEGLEEKVKIKENNFKL